MIDLKEGILEIFAESAIQLHEIYEELQIRQRARIALYHRERWKLDAAWRKERIKASTERNRIRRANPEYRAQMNATRNKSRKERYQNDPVYREAMKARSRQYRNRT